jgi:hypothetical protein
MKAFLNLFGQLDEINFGDSRFALEYDAVRFNATDRRVFVSLPLTVLKSSANVSDAVSVAIIAIIVFQEFTRLILPLCVLHSNNKIALES